MSWFADLVLAFEVHPDRERTGTWQRKRSDQIACSSCRGRSCSLAPSGHRVAPSGENVAPSRRGVAPSGHRVALSGDDVAPSGGGVAPSGHRHVMPCPLRHDMT